MFKLSSLDQQYLKKLAMEFDSKEALEKYLKEHPKADRSNHSVKSQEGVPSKESKSVSIPPKYREQLKGYDLEVVGDDYKQAVEIARKVEKGISESADICALKPDVCKGNLGLSRDKMPQIPGDMSVKQMLNAVGKDGKPDEKTRAKGKAAVEAGADPNDDRSVLESMLEHFKSTGVKLEKKKIPVGKLKATQSEIKAEKAFGMANAHLKGKFPDIGDQIVVSSDGHILDGHHRWAALLTIDPSREMNVIQVGMTMKEMLDRADELPGVYREDFKGNPIALPASIAKRKKDFLKKSKGSKK